jgi:heme oxygenase
MIHAEFKTKLQMFARDIQTSEAKLTEDFLYYFSWVGEELWKMKYQQQFIQRIYDAACESEETIEQDLKKQIKTRLQMLREECLKPYNVRTDSTGALHRETSTWKFQCDLELMEWLNRIVK